MLDDPVVERTPAGAADELLDDRMLAQFAPEGGLHAELEFYAQLLRKVVVAEKLGMLGRERQVTDALLNGLCDELEAEPVDILDLRGCTQIGRSPSRLPRLSMVSVLCMASCKGVSGSLILACLQGMGGLKVNACVGPLCGSFLSTSALLLFLFPAYVVSCMSNCFLFSDLRRIGLYAWRRGCKTRR